MEGRLLGAIAVVLVAGVGRAAIDTKGIRFIEIVGQQSSALQVVYLWCVVLCATE
jgi:hypothetical protein